MSSTLLSNSIMDIFDDLPHFLNTPPTECKFVTMVRTLLDAPEKKMKHAEFRRRFAGAKRVFLEPFFDFTGPDDAPDIKLRYADFDNALACAKHHWESRVDLKCRHGHPLAEIRAHDGLASTCFSCNMNHCRDGHYRCLSCTFQVCSDCMIKKNRRPPRSPLRLPPPRSPLRLPQSLHRLAYPVTRPRLTYPVTRPQSLRNQPRREPEEALNRV